MLFGFYFSCSVCGDIRCQSRSVAKPLPPLVLDTEMFFWSGFWYADGLDIEPVTYNLKYNKRNIFDTETYKRVTFSYARDAAPARVLWVRIWFPLNFYHVCCTLSSDCMIFCKLSNRMCIGWVGSKCGLRGHVARSPKKNSKSLQCALSAGIFFYVRVQDALLCITCCV